MKRLAILTAAALVTLPILAEQKADPAPPAVTQTGTAQEGSSTAQVVTPPSTVAAPAVPAVADSPLVAAAKRSAGSKKKSAIVITNDTLRGQHAKVTTTAVQTPLKTAQPVGQPPAPTQVFGSPSGTSPEEEAARKKAAEAEAARVKKMEELRNQLDNESLANDVDPARVEHQLDQLSKQQPPPPPKKP